MNINKYNKLNGIDTMNPDKVNSRGIYFDSEEQVMFRLNDVQLIALRAFYDDETIGNDRLVSKSAKAEYRDMIRETHANNVKYRLQREKKKKRVRFVNQLKHCAKNPKIKVAGYVIGCELVLLAALGVGGAQKVDAPTLPKDDTSHYVASTINPSELPQANQDLINMITDYNSVSQDFVASEPEDEEIQYVDFVDEIQQHRQELARYYCSVYRLNYDVVYNKLVEVTDNFSSEEFVNGIIPGVTCKGESIQSESEDLLFMTAIRHMSQIPGDFGLTYNDLRNDPEEYVGDKTYEQCIAYYGNILGEGDNELRDLAYGIYIAETGGDSNLLVNGNNYGGLTCDSGFAHFDNKDVGAIEFLCTVKYGYMHKGLDTPKKMQEIYAPSYENDGAWWVSTVDCAKGYAEDILSKYDENNLDNTQNFNR